MQRPTLASLIVLAATALLPACDEADTAHHPAPEEASMDTSDLSSDTAEADKTPLAWTGVATWTAYTSDNKPPVTCATGSMVTGFQCLGRYCDDVRLKCQPQTGHTLTTRTWSSYFSEEGTNYRTCTDFMTGIAATGNYSDNLSIECTTSTTRSPRSCVWSAYFSEEDPAFEAPSGYFIRSLQCSGSNCDRMRAEYCLD